MDVRDDPDVTPDAVVVVPGIMGSALYDTVAGQTIWGLRPGWYARAWSRSGPGLSRLAVTDDELDGKSGRVKATGLLTWPAFMPILAGLEPYTPLIRAIGKVVRHPAAVREFPYDWRLPVAHNASELAKVVDRHLASWRTLSGRPDARVVLVAHSMGGLLCQALCAIPGATEGVRAIITLGTPFDGAAKAAVILSSGHGGPLPLPAARLRSVAVTMPGLHDLLPSYRCVHENASTVRTLTPADVKDLNGNDSWFATTLEQRTRLADVPMVGHRALIGVAQPTISSLTLSGGIATGHEYTFRPDNGDLARHEDGTLLRLSGVGDGTVPRNSALPRGSVAPMPVAQQHTTLAHSEVACQFVCDVLVHGQADTGERLGDGEVGLSLPDVVCPGIEWTATLAGIDYHQARCTITDADTHQVIDHPRPHRRDGQVRVAATLPAPGVYRVRIDGGGEPVTQYVMADDPDAVDD